MIRSIKSSRSTVSIISPAKIRILAAGRNEQKVRARFAPYDKADWFEFVYYDASAMENTLTQPCDYIIHGASNASPNKITKEPAETMASNFIGLKFLLEHARKVNAKRVLYISSSEVYGKKDDNMPFREGEYGYIDILNPRMSYSVGKRAAETLCASFADEYGVSTVITRPGHIYGPTAAENDNRVSSAWPYDVARGQNIVMKSGTYVGIDIKEIINILRQRYLSALICQRMMLGTRLLLESVLKTIIKRWRPLNLIG